MAQVINTNVSSLNAQRNLNNSQSALATSLQRLSSGLRINSAKDDAAGLAITDRMTSQVRGLNQAARNANDGISLAQTAESGLTEVGTNLQRIRELAVQSANATNTASDRASLNAEVSQLLAEIQRVSTSSQFNGQNILDGTFTSAQFQVGANANQTIIASTGNSQTNAIGSYQVSGGAAAVTSAALASGDLLINGTDVGVSTTGSAESKAQAINAVANLTGVTATASTTLTSTNTMLRNQTLQAGDLSINSVNIGAVAGSNNLVTQGANLAAAINRVTNQTGVQAIASQSTGALTLTSTTGKDIAITSSSDAGATRLANASGLVTYSGTATASTSTATFLVGSASTNALTVTGFNVDAATTITALTGKTVTIQGVTFEYSDAASALTTASNVRVSLAGVASNDNIASALNTAISGQITAGNLKNITTGVATNVVTLTSAYNTATVSQVDATMSIGASVAEVTTAGTGAAVGDTLNVGGVTYEFGFAGGTPTTGNVLVALSTSAAGIGTNFAAAVNAQYTAGNTNIQAAGTNVVTLTSVLKGSGTGNVTVTEPIQTGTAASVVGAAATAGTDGTNIGETGRGIIELNSATSFLITGTATAKGGLASANVTLSAIGGLDISTVAGANTAISLVDGALSQVATIRGSMGALQNRFSSVVSSLTASSENLASARSRIQDADFAAETAALTRNQILQQAGIAMLAQANALPNQVLTLLRG